MERSGGERGLRERRDLDEIAARGTSLVTPRPAEPLPPGHDDNLGSQAHCLVQWLASMMYRVNDSAAVSRGVIARTFLDGGTTNIDGSNPPISVVGHISSEVVGNYVTKVGVTTGWTSGYIDAINQTKVSQNDGHTRYGTTSANFGDDEGDSGAPVFYPENGDRADFEGIAWGKYSRTCGLFQTCYGGYYSPLSGILTDLGASISQFNFNNGITISSPSLSGSVTYSASCNGGSNVPVLTWTSSSVSGTSWPLTYYVIAEDFYGDGTSSGQYISYPLSAGTTTYQPCNSVSAYLGGSPPGPGQGYSSYQVEAYDSGIAVFSYVVYFQW
jgi:hypothetical protein